MNRVQVITGFVGYQPPHSSLEPLLSGSVRPVLKFNRLLEVYGQDHWSDPSTRGCADPMPTSTKIQISGRLRRLRQP